MPLALVQYKTNRDLESFVEKLALLMPGIVAPALDMPGYANSDYRLTPDDIEVWVTESGKLDVNTKDIEVIIWAHEYPERRVNLEERKNQIIRGVREIAIVCGRTDISGFVWVLLQPSAFGIL